MTAEPYWSWSAARIARAVASRQVRCREVTESCLARLDEVNGDLVAVVDVDAAGALAAADRADEKVDRGEPLGVLHGVPVTTQVNVDQHGCATTNGVRAFEHRLALNDNPVVGSLREAGAIILGRTNTSSSSWRWFTDNELYGRTLNPLNSEITAGGSSGGAAAAVSAGIVPVAQGSGSVGSIRYPAFACGVLGLRPTQGRIPCFDATEPTDSPPFSQLMSVQGALTRTVEDMRLALQAMAKPSDLDPWSVPVPLELAPTAPCRVAMVRSVPWAAVDVSVSSEVDAAARLLAADGYELVEVLPPSFEQVMEVFRAKAWEARNRLLHQVGELGDRSVRDVAGAMTSLAAGMDGDRYLELFARRTTILREWSAFLDDYPLILLPVSWRRPFPADHDQRGPDMVRELVDALEPSIAASICGLPALAVPTSIGPAGPGGVQLVAGRFREDRCLSTAEVLLRDDPAHTLRRDPPALMS